MYRKLFIYFMSLNAVLAPGFLNGHVGEKGGEKIHTVMVLLEAKQGKEELLKNALVKVAAESRQEESCLEYRFYQDKENPVRFGLYEKWKSKELHQLQFSKPYIIDFAKEAENLLKKPFEGVFGEEVVSNN